MSIIHNYNICSYTTLFPSPRISTRKSPRERPRPRLRDEHTPLFLLVVAVAVAAASASLQKTYT
jgi:hypothetical protein